MTRTCLIKHQDWGYLGQQICDVSHRVSESRNCCTYDHEISHSDAVEFLRSSTYGCENRMRLRVNTVERSGCSIGIRKKFRVIVADSTNYFMCVDHDTEKLAAQL